MGNSTMQKKSYETAAHTNDGYVPKDDALIVFRGALDHAEAEIILTQALLNTEILFARSVDPVRESNLKRLQGDLQELVDVLRAVMTAEYMGTAVDGLGFDDQGPDCQNFGRPNSDTRSSADQNSDKPFRLFGLTLDELQERSHHAQEHYGVPTMTRPDHRFGEVYARLNLIRTELRQVETAAVRLFREQGVAATNGSSTAGSASAGSNVIGFEPAGASTAANTTTELVNASATAEPARPDLLYLLNRLSSAAHVLMCRYLADEHVDLTQASAPAGREI